MANKTEHLPFAFINLRKKQNGITDTVIVEFGSTEAN